MAIFTLYVHSAVPALPHAARQDHKDVSMELSKTRLRLALATAFVQRNADTDVSVEFEIKGSKAEPLGVRSNKDYKVGALILVPFTPNIQISGRPPPNGIMVPEFPCKDANGKLAFAWLCPRVELPISGTIVCDSGSHFLNAFWSCKVAPDSMLANMTASTMVMKVCVSEVKLPHGKSSGSTAEDTVALPVIYNKSPIKASDLLLKAPCIELPASFKRAKTDGV